MNTEQQNKILWGIACVALFIAVVVGVTVVYNEGVEKVETDVETVKEPTPLSIPIINEELDFTVNLEGGMEHGDILTISGTVPNPKSPITGIIYHGETTSPKATIVYLLQTTSDEVGFYSSDVVINDDYLWKKDVNYTISIGNNGDHKTLEFSR